jgi:hypothetical protein
MGTSFGMQVVERGASLSLSVSVETRLGSVGGMLLVRVLVDPMLCCILVNLEHLYTYLLPQTTLIHGRSLMGINVRAAGLSLYELVVFVSRLFSLLFLSAVLLLSEGSCVDTCR